MIDEITRHLNSKSDKVDLKAEKIELGIADDIKKYADGTTGIINIAKQWNTIIKATLKDYLKSETVYKKALEQYDLDVKDARKTESNTKASIKRHESTIKDSNKIIATAKKAAAELGVDYTAIAGVKELESNLTKIASEIDSMIATNADISKFGVK